MITIPQIIGIAILRGGYMAEKLKSMQLDINDKTKRKIEEEGIYHFTSKENAEKIIASGNILPTKGILNNHFSKSRDGSKFADYVYMFAGLPSDYDLTKNLPVFRNGDGTIYAVKHSPDKSDLENYTQRFEDGAITYEGVLNLQNSHPEIVRFIQKNNQLIQIPINMEIEEKANNAPKEVMSRIIKIAKVSCKEMFKMTTFYDKDHKLKDLRQKRKLENKLIKQYKDEEYRNRLEEKQNIQKNPEPIADSKEYKITMKSLVKKTIGTAIELKDEALRQFKHERESLLQKGQEKI